MHSFSVRMLSPAQVRTLYEERLRDDFPPDELKPLWIIERAIARGEYVCYGAAEGEQTLAYAFFVRLEFSNGTCALLDYYAVRKDLRGKGMGGGFLQALIAGPLKGMTCVLLEVDDPDCAADAQERMIRERRLRFYLRNGLTDTAVTAVVYGVSYRILVLPVGVASSPEETRRVYAAIYRAMLPAKIYAEKVEIHSP